LANHRHPPASVGWPLQILGPSGDFVLMRVAASTLASSHATREPSAPAVRTTASSSPQRADLAHQPESAGARGPSNPLLR
jgi:hypothetical protein